MRSFQVSIAAASCTLMLSAGVAFADDLHNPMNTAFLNTMNLPPIGAPASPGQTGSNVLASCGSTAPVSFSVGAGAKSNTGTNSPFNPSAPAKRYAGNMGNPATNPTAVAQYDNACAQAALHSQMP